MLLGIENYKKTYTNYLTFKHVYFSVIPYYRKFMGWLGYKKKHWQDNQQFLLNAYKVLSNLPPKYSVKIPGTLVAGHWVWWHQPTIPRVG